MCRAARAATAPLLAAPEKFDHIDGRIGVEARCAGRLARDAKKDPRPELHRSAAKQEVVVRESQTCLRRGPRSHRRPRGRAAPPSQQSRRSSRGASGIQPAMARSSPSRRSPALTCARSPSSIVVVSGHIHYAATRLDASPARWSGSVRRRRVAVIARDVCPVRPVPDLDVRCQERSSGLLRPFRNSGTKIGRAS